MLRKVLLLIVGLVLAACSGPRLPFEKEQPTDSSIIAPPWEAFVKAGPGAEKELDLETLNGSAIAGPTVQPPPLIAEMEAAGQEEAVTELPTQDKKKSGVEIKSVALPSVQGAGGKGNGELTQAMRQVLREAGWPVVTVPADNALTIRGNTKISAVRGGTQNVKLQWIVSTPDGKQLGEVSQSNDIPAGSLDAGWGENARFATEAAAEGIFKLIQNYR